MECNVCLEAFVDPRSLSCGHSFCYKCILAVVESGNKRKNEQPDPDIQKEGGEVKMVDVNSSEVTKITCPVCRVPTELKEITVNYALRDAIETIKPANDHQINLGSNHCLNFQTCKRLSDNYCEKCEGFICSICEIEHKKSPFTKTHTLQNKNQSPNLPTCEKHKEKTRLFCNYCTKLVCTSCILLEHRDSIHSISDISDVSKKRRKEIKQTKSLLGEEKGKFISILKEIQQEEKTLLSKLNAIQQQLNDKLKEKTKFEEELTKIQSSLEFIDNYSNSPEENLLNQLKFIEILSAVNKKVENTFCRKDKKNKKKFKYQTYGEDSPVVEDSKGGKLEIEFEQSFGKSGSSIGEFSYPSAVCVNSFNQIIVCDYTNHRIQVFNSDLQYLFKIGMETQGSGDGEFFYPCDVSVDDSDNIIITDQSNHRIQIFSATGQFIRAFGTRGSGDGQFFNPAGTCIEKTTKRIFVVDRGNHRIQIFTPMGEFIKKFGTNGPNDGCFNYPKSIVSDDKGMLYVTDTSNNRIQLFDPDGNFVKVLETKCLFVPECIALFPGNNIIISDRSRSIHRLVIFNKETGEVVAYYGSTGSVDGHFNRPGGLAVCNNRIFVADSNNHRIVIMKFSKN